MSEKRSHVPLTQNNLQENDELIEPQKIISLIKSRKYLFIGTLLAAFVIGYV